MQRYGGQVVIETIDKKTGEVVDTYGPSSNMILDQGASLLWQRITKTDSGGAFRFSSIAIGTDVGDEALFSTFNPEPPNRDMNEDDQDVIYFTPTSNMTYNYPGQNVIQVVGLIDGVEAMTQSFPNQFDAEFTSATLRTGNNKAFAYKRFPARYITRDVDIRIIWTLTMQNAATFCGFQTPADSGVSSIYIANQIELIKVDTDGEEQWKYTPHSMDISTVSADMSNYVYTGDINGLFQKNSSQRTLIWQNVQDSVDFPNAELSGIVYDNRGNIYISALNGQVKRLTENGGQVWRYVDETSEFTYVYGVDSEYWAYVYNPAQDYLIKVDPNGIVEPLSQGVHLASIVSAKVDSSGRSITIDGSSYARIFSDLGDLLVEQELPAVANDLGVNDNTSIVIGYESGAVTKYDYSINETWTLTLGNPISHVEVDSDGAVYATTKNDNNLHKITPAGAVEWTYEGALAPINALAVDRTTT